MIATSSVSLVLWLGLVHSICSPPLSKNAPLVAIQKFACHPYTTSQIFPQRTASLLTVQSSLVCGISVH